MSGSSFTYNHVPKLPLRYPKTDETKYESAQSLFLPSFSFVNRYRPVAFWILTRSKRRYRSLSGNHPTDTKKFSKTFVRRKDRNADVDVALLRKSFLHIIPVIFDKTVNEKTQSVV